jgi:5-methylthioadenosine/S-adenosylhomocysteine deaminase
LEYPINKFFPKRLAMDDNGILILPEWLIDVPEELPRKDWGIRVCGDRIAAVDSHVNLRQQYPHDQCWEAPHQVLSPGFVDAHTHLYGVLAHGIPLNKAPSGFWPFLEDFWWPLVEDGLDTDMVCAATDLNCARMLQSGVTSFYDCTEAPKTLPGVLMSQAEVVERYGLRGTLSFEATERVSAENGRLGLEENASLIREYQQKDSLISGMMCFHTTFTCSADFIRKAFDIASDLGVLTHMHCSEGTFEPEYTLRNFSVRPMAYYDQLGLAGPGMLASQCVQIDAREIQIMAERGVRMSHMPLSNCEVGGGIAPLPELVEAGVLVGLGSDGYITDFFEIMRGAFLIHKASHCDPRVMPAGQVWRLATEGGARVIGLKNVGRLEVGWKADFQLIEPNLPTRLTEHNLYEQLLLYCNHKNVAATVVNGTIRMQAGKILAVDLDALLENTRSAADRLWEKAN